MSTLFNRHSPFEALIARENQRRAREANLDAVEALELGLAFMDESEEAKTEPEEETFLDDPRFEEAIRAFAQMDEKA